MDDFDDFSSYEGPRHRRPQERYDRDISFHTPAPANQVSQYAVHSLDTSSHFNARAGNVSRQVYDDDQLIYEDGSAALDDYGRSESPLLSNNVLLILCRSCSSGRASPRSSLAGQPWNKSFVSTTKAITDPAHG